LAEEAVDLLHPVLSPRVQRMEGPWTTHAPLPGGDFRRLLGERSAADLGFEQLCRHIRQAHPWLPDTLVKRYTRSYGTLFARVIGSAASLQDLGEEVAPGLYAAELTYLCDHEWARTADDVLWRRSKLGLHFDETQRQAVADWLAAHEEKAAA
ncbi:MAG: glycerol-3-phosphate dehydrogenase C-terminal domain-containing protein, partial [Lautropia sp.]